MNATKRTVTTVRHEYVIEDYGDGVPYAEVVKAVTWARNDRNEYHRTKGTYPVPEEYDNTYRLRPTDNGIVVFWEEEK